MTSECHAALNQWQLLDHVFTPGRFWDIWGSLSQRQKDVWSIGLCLTSYHRSPAGPGPSSHKDRSLYPERGTRRPGVPGPTLPVWLKKSIGRVANQNPRRRAAHNSRPRKVTWSRGYFYTAGQAGLFVSTCPPKDIANQGGSDKLHFKAPWFRPKSCCRLIHTLIPPLLTLGQIEILQTRM